MNEKRIQAPLTDDDVKGLKVADRVLISGKIYTARDAAHMRLLDAINNQDAMPVDLSGQIIYYVGPSPARPGQVIGSCGPTSSYRMDDMTQPLLNLGLKGMIGKGTRQQHVIDAMIKHQAVYFAAIGGAGALIANSVVASEVVAYDELGAEAIHVLEVIDLPVIVAIDCKGHSIYNYPLEG